MKIIVSLEVNGKNIAVEVEEDKTLLYLLREVLGLTGTKEGCGIGECGACTVLMDGKPVNSCLVLAGQADGKEVTTIEGLAENGKLHPIQESFVEVGAIQCGYCTPGMVMSAKALLDNSPAPSSDEIRTAIAGNLCRCTGYVKIIKAIKTAAGKVREISG